MKQPLRIAFALVVILAAGFALRRQFAPAPASPHIHVSGNIEVTEVDLSFKIPGKLVELRVREGDWVKAGDVIARMDRESLQRQRDREQAALAAVSAQRMQVQTAIEQQRAAIEGELALRQAEIRAARAQLADLEAGARPQEIEAAEAQWNDARTWLEQARREFERGQTLIAREDISRQQFEQLESRFQSMRQMERQARERLTLLKEGPRRQAIEAARAQLERAEAGLRLVEVNRIELRRREQELAVRDAELERVRASIAVMDAQLADTILTAPIDGVVTVKPAELGEVMAAGATVATIGGLSHPWLRAYLAESDLGRVKLGAKVRLRTDSFPGKVYWGKVTFISPEAEFTPKQIQTKDERTKLVYRIKVEVGNPQQELKANMPVDAEILL